MELNKIFQGDCLEVMKEIKDASIDMIFADLPYGVTQNEWDVVIPFAPLWEAYERIIKPNGAIVLTAQGLFAYRLALSNEALYRYDIIWHKSLGSGHLNAKRMPLRNHEQALVFYKKQPTYNPQLELGINKKGKRKKDRNGDNYGKFAEGNPDFEYFDDGGKRYPNSVISISNGNKNKEFGLNSTQKPVALVAYFVLTYSNPGDVILDNCIGSGTTGIACLETDRQFIGIEKRPDEFERATKRLQSFKANPQIKFFAAPQPLPQQLSL